MMVAMGQSATQNEAEGRHEVKQLAMRFQPAVA